MIKTEIESEEELTSDGVDEQTEFSQGLGNAPWILGLVSLIVILAAGGIVYLIHADSNPSPRLVSGTKVGNVSALPLINSSSSTQASSSVPGLSSSGINLQNNLPASGQGTPTSSPLQSASNSLGSGQ
ncbi:MAG: hypothetical protein ACREF7_04645 [Candidatus Saccharimonadales bacterium]